MHHVQRRAILAIISMIESGLKEIRSVLSDGTPEPDQTVLRPRPEPTYGSPLTDDEEQSLEHVMELSRQEMLKQGTSMTEAFYEGRSKPLSGFFDEDEPG